MEYYTALKKTKRSLGPNMKKISDRINEKKKLKSGTVYFVIRVKRGVGWREGITYMYIKIYIEYLWKDFQEH